MCEINNHKKETIFNKLEYNKKGLLLSYMCW